MVSSDSSSFLSLTRDAGANSLSLFLSSLYSLPEVSLDSFPCESQSLVVSNCPFFLLFVRN